MNRFTLLLLALWCYSSAHGQFPHPAQDRLGCSWGFKYAGKWVILPEFERVEEFSREDSLATVHLPNGQHGLIRPDGTYAFGPSEYYIHTTHLKRVTPKCYYTLQSDDSVGLFNASDRKVMYTAHAHEIYSLGNGLFRIRLWPGRNLPGRTAQTTFTGLADLEKVLIEPRDQPFEPLAHNRAVFSTDKGYYLGKPDGTLIGETCYPFILPKWINGMLLFEKNGLQGFLDSNGNEILPPMWVTNYRLSEKDFDDWRFEDRKDFVQLKNGKTQKHNLLKTDGTLLFETGADSLYNPPHASYDAYYFKNASGRWQKAVLIHSGQTVLEFDPDDHLEIFSSYLKPNEQRVRTHYDAGFDTHPGKVHLAFAMIDSQNIRFYNYSGDSVFSYPAIDTPELWIPEHQAHFLVKSGGKWHMHNREDYSLLHSWDMYPQLTECTLRDQPKRSLYFSKSQGKWGVYSLEYELLVPHEYDSFDRVSERIKNHLHYYHIFFKGQDVYLLDDLLDGNPDRFRPINQEDPLVHLSGQRAYYVKPSGEWVFTGRNDHQSFYRVQDSKGDLVIMPSQQRLEIYSISQDSFVAWVHPSYYGEIRLIADDLLQADHYLYTFGNHPICEGFEMIKPYGDYYLGTDSAQKLHLLTQRCEPHIKDGLNVMACFNPEKRWFFRIKPDQQEDIGSKFSYYDKVWELVAVEADGSLKKLLPDDFRDPFPLSQWPQLVHTTSGQGILDSNLEYIIPPTCKSIHYQEQVGFFFQRTKGSSDVTKLPSYQLNDDRTFEPYFDLQPPSMGMYYPDYGEWYYPKPHRFHIRNSTFGLMSMSGDTLLRPNAWRISLARNGMVAYSDSTGDYIYYLGQKTEPLDKLGRPLNEQMLIAEAFVAHTQGLAETMADMTSAQQTQVWQLLIKNSEALYPEYLPYRYPINHDPFFADIQLPYGRTMNGSPRYQYTAEDRSDETKYVLVGVTDRMITIATSRLSPFTGRGEGEIVRLEKSPDYAYEWHSNRDEITYLVSDTSIQQLDLSDILFLTTENQELLNGWITEYILSHKRMKVQCPQNSSYFRMMRNRFRITQGGLEFMAFNLETHREEAILIPKDQIQPLMKIVW